MIVVALQILQLADSCNDFWITKPVTDLGLIFLTYQS
jgi:hypothetical protein